MERNDELRQAWDFVENTGRSIFLTGKAGTGKTTFLKTVVERSRKRSVVVAPTGVAAINAGGVTIHSFFQLPLSPFVPNAQIKEKFEFSRQKRKIIASLDLLIIDEISMVRSDLLDAVDSVLRRYRDRYQPFGGLQLLMIGDLQQLTPVVTPEDEQMLKPYYDTPYFFGSKALSQTDYVTIQLNRVYRQQDTTFLTMLNHIRDGRPTQDDLNRLNSRCKPAFIPNPDDGYIRLTTHNHLANYYNESELRKLTSKAFHYEAKIEGTFPEYSYPTAQTLELKVGAQVMFVKNDPSGNHLYYNGRIGRVTYVDEHKIFVHCQGDADAIEVEPLAWENAKYTLDPETREIKTEVQGKFTQFPLRLAWAITIHKSQGLTFDRAIIDANQSFAPGQVYVALSRCRTLEGMVLSSPIEQRAIINDERVDSYISQQETAAQRSIEQLPQLKDEYFRQLLLDLFDFRPILYQEEYLLRQFEEFLSHGNASLTHLHKQTVEGLKMKVKTVADKWTDQIRRMTTEQLHQDPFLERVIRSASYFSETLETLMKKPLELTKEVKPGNKMVAQRLQTIVPELIQSWLSRRYLLNRMAEKGFSIDSYLREKQMATLDALDEGQVKKGRERMAKTPKEAKPKKEPKMPTHEVSLQLYNQGLNVSQIAQQRGLTTGTVFNHLARYVEKGDVALDDLVTKEHQLLIRKAFEKLGLNETITAYKEQCPPDVTFDEIRLISTLL